MALETGITLLAISISVLVLLLQIMSHSSFMGDTMAILLTVPHGQPTKILTGVFPDISYSLPTMLLD
jgi:hypothetical protein